MTLESVAKVAGVSPSTVSRVINGKSNVLPETARVVNYAMQRLNFNPKPRGRQQSGNITGNSAPTASFLFVVLGRHSADRSPGFETLLRGVSRGSEDLHLNMNIVFPSDSTQVKLSQLAAQVDGMILHGGVLDDASASSLQHLPAVWLMANAERPSFGDQILPDNTAIGDVAASYLVERGHRHLALCSLDWYSWSMEIRAHAFVRGAERLGANAVVVDIPHGGLQQHLNGKGANNGNGFRKVGRRDNVGSLATTSDMVDHLLSLSPRPTGLFVAEDRQVMPIVHELRQRGLTVGHDCDLEIISCNNERLYFAGLYPAPATIDIRTETIGYRGVKMLLSRIRGNSPDERIRTLVDPILIDPSGSPV